jgi:hypothetical protein
MCAVAKELAEAYVSIWQKAVETQMHFNEMSVKSRQLGLTFVAASLGVGIVLLSQGRDFAIQQEWGILRFEIHVSVFIFLAAVFALVAVRILDLNVYHKMLRGAVSFGEDFEENYMKQIFALDKGMTQAISHFSRYQDAHTTKERSRYKYEGSRRVTAEEKIRRFYRTAILVLVISTVILFLMTGHPTYLSN